MASFTIASKGHERAAICLDHLHVTYSDTSHMLIYPHVEKVLCILTRDQPAISRIGMVRKDAIMMPHDAS